MTAVWSRVSSSVCLAGFSSRDFIVAKSALLLNHARARKRQTTSTRRQEPRSLDFPCLIGGTIPTNKGQDGFCLSVPLQPQGQPLFFTVLFH